MSFNKNYINKKRQLPLFVLICKCKQGIRIVACTRSAVEDGNEVGAINWVHVFSKTVNAVWRCSVLSVAEYLSGAEIWGFVFSNVKSWICYKF